MNEKQAKALVKDQIRRKTNYGICKSCAVVSMFVAIAITFYNFHIRHILFCITNGISMIAIVMSMVIIVFNRKRDDKKYFWIITFMISNLDFILNDLCFFVIELSNHEIEVICFVMMIGIGCVAFFWEKHKLKYYPETPKEDKMIYLDVSPSAIGVLGAGYLSTIRISNNIKEFMANFAGGTAFVYTYLWGRKMAKVTQCIRNIKKYKLQAYVEEILKEYENDAEDKCQ